MILDRRKDIRILVAFVLKYNEEMTMALFETWTCQLGQSMNTQQSAMMAELLFLYPQKVTPCYVALSLCDHVIQAVFFSAVKPVKTH